MNLSVCIGGWGVKIFNGIYDAFDWMNLVVIIIIISGVIAVIKLTHTYLRSYFYVPVRAQLFSRSHVSYTAGVLLSRRIIRFDLALK